MGEVVGPALADFIRRAVEEGVQAALADVPRAPAHRAPAAEAVAGVTLNQLFEEYRRARQHEEAWTKIAQLLAPLLARLGDIPAARLTEQVWGDHRAVRAKTDTRLGRPPKPQTLTLEFQRAKEMLKFGVRAGLLEKNGLADAKPERTVSMRETWLDEHGIQRLLGGLHALKDERARLLTRAFILLCVDSMLRFNEARLLRRDQIVDDCAVLSPKNTKNKKRRVVGLTPRTLAAINEIPPVVGTQRIFVNPQTRDPYSGTRIREWFAIVRAESGVNELAAEGEQVVVHTLRHSGASAADSRGAAATAIRDALGHAHLSTTERYLHRHRASGAREMARLMAEGAERERMGPHRAAANERTADAAAVTRE